MDLAGEYPIQRFESGELNSKMDPVITEARIELDVNDGQLRLAMLCLPQELEALAVGFLVAEGALRRREDLKVVEYQPKQNKVILKGDFDADVLESITLRWTWGTGCGGGGTSRDLNSSAYKSIDSGKAVTAVKLLALFEQFNHLPGLWRTTGGVHTCALADENRIIHFAEDVGRHNAFDKIIGKAFIDGTNLTDKLVITTGRLSAEIVSKAVACGLPILVSRSAVSSLAIKLAGRFGMTLVGFLRGKRLNVYTGFQRIQRD